MLRRRNLMAQPSGYSLDSYVHDSVMLWLDGVENTRSGHNADAAVWEDLVGSVNFTKTSKFTFSDNCILPTGTIISDNGIVIPDEYTIEVVYQYDGSTYHGFGFSNQAPLFKGRPETQAPWWVRGTAYDDRVYYSEAFSFNATHSIAISQSADGAKCYHNGVLSGTKSSVYVDSTSQKIRNYSGSEILTGKIFTIRLHSRVLTDDELVKNYEVDKQRFSITEVS